MLCFISFFLYLLWFFFLIFVLLYYNLQVVSLMWLGYCYMVISSPSYFFFIIQLLFSPNSFFLLCILSSFYKICICLIYALPILSPFVIVCVPLNSIYLFTQWKPFVYVVVFMLGVNIITLNLFCNVFSFIVYSFCFFQK